MQRTYDARLLPPDVRFGASDCLRAPGTPQKWYDLEIRAETSLDPTAAPYLHLCDRTATLSCSPPTDLPGVVAVLRRRVRALAFGADITDLAFLVMSLDMIDVTFRGAGLWQGNVYLAGAEALAKAMNLVDQELVSAVTSARLYELAALELIYLFPVAGKFRAGDYDGTCQLRLNGWGRALAAELGAAEPAVCAWRDASLARLRSHVASERTSYEGFLSDLDVAKQAYLEDKYAASRALPIPVLV